MTPSLSIYHVDDEPIYIEQVKNKIAEFPELKYLGASTNAVDALEKLKRLRPDLLLLDIEMPGQNGIELAFQLKTTNTFIVFLTNYDVYFVSAFKVFAFNYLLKPLTSENLLEIITQYRRIRNKILEKQESQLSEMASYFRKQVDQPNRIFVNTQKEIIVLQLDEVIYLSAEGSYTEFHLKDKKTLVSGKNLKTYAAVIENNSNFVRIHRSYVINLKFLEKIDKKKTKLTFFFTDGKSLTMSSFRKDEWFNKLKLLN